jgi:hypothetical protein
MINLGYLRFSSDCNVKYEIYEQYELPILLYLAESLHKL